MTNPEFRPVARQNPPVLQPPEMACSVSKYPLSSVSGRRRYNTLDFAGKVVCHETAGFIGFFLPRQRRRLWKPPPRERCPHWIPQPTGRSRPCWITQSQGDFHPLWTPRCFHHNRFPELFTRNSPACGEKRSYGNPLQYKNTP